MDPHGDRILLRSDFANKYHPVTIKRRPKIRKTAPPATGVERQRKYRSKLKVASLDVSGPTIELIRRLRRKYDLTTDQLVSAALSAFDVPTAAAPAQRSHADATKALDDVAAPKSRRDMPKVACDERTNASSAEGAAISPHRLRQSRTGARPDGHGADQLDMGF